jgi:hypothetical protein
MPLVHGKKNVSRNIKELMDTGRYSQRLSVAIAMSVSRHKKKRRWDKIVISYSVSMSFLLVSFISSILFNLSLFQL